MEEESTQLNNHKVIRRKKQNASFNDELDEYIAHHYIAIPQIDKPDGESPPGRRKDIAEAPPQLHLKLEDVKPVASPQLNPMQAELKRLAFPSTQMNFWKSNRLRVKHRNSLDEHQRLIEEYY